MAKNDLPLAVSAALRFFQTREAGKVAYYVDDSGGGIPLVLIHTVNAAASAFEIKPIFEHYAGKRTVYAIDLPGFGFSDRTDRAFTPQLYATVMHEFVRDIVGAEFVDALAVSLGCEFLARVANTDPVLFRSLVLISPTGFGRYSAESSTLPPSSEKALRTLRFPLVGAPLFSALTTKPSIRYFLRQSFYGETPQALVEYAYQTTRPKGAKNAPLHFVAGRLFTYDARTSLYNRIDQPTLMLYDKDPYTDYSSVPDMLDAHPNWQAVRIADTRGLPHWEKLPAVVSALDTFISEL